MENNDKLKEIDINPIQDGLFRGCSRMSGGKKLSYLKTVTHILQ